MKGLTIVGLSLSIMSMVALTACGESKDSATPNSSATPSASAAASSTPAPAKAVKLKMWGGVPEENGPKAAVDKWNASHTDIQVEYVRFVNDDAGNTKLDTALLSTSDAPDLFVTYSDAILERRIKAGMVTPLDDLMKTVNFDVDGIIGASNIVKTNNKIYYLPGAKSFNAIFFNKSSLDAIGAKVPTDWTWDEYAELSKKLTKPGQFGTMIDPTWENFGWQVLTTAQPLNAYYAADGTSNFNHPAFKKGLEMQKGLIDAKAMMPFAEGVANKITGQDELLKGKAASVFTGNYLIRYVKDDKAYPDRKFTVAFAPMPQMEKGKNVNTNGVSDLISINASSQHKEAAMKFLDWYLKEGNLELVPGGRIPSNLKTDITKLADIIIGDKGQYIDKESFMNVLKINYTFKTNTITTASSDFRKAMQEESEKYFMNVQSIDKTIEALKKRGDDALKAAAK